MPVWSAEQTANFFVFKSARFPSASTAGTPNKLQVTFDVKSVKQPGKKPDYKEARKWRKEKEKSKNVVDGPSIHFHQPKFLGNIINGTSNNRTFGINHLLEVSEESKKRKKSQEDEEENEGIDDSTIPYDRLIVGIKAPAVLECYRSQNREYLSMPKTLLCARISIKFRSSKTQANGYRNCKQRITFELIC
ncbi:unnamed protein product [Rhizophagus irregularis]|nr:unnamed protein product [Rhizophagus irregularis]